MHPRWSFEDLLIASLMQIPFLVSHLPHVLVVFAFYTHGHLKDFFYLTCFARKVYRALSSLLDGRVRSCYEFLLPCYILPPCYFHYILRWFFVYFAHPVGWYLPTKASCWLPLPFDWFSSSSRAQIGSQRLGQALPHSLLIFLKGLTSPAFSSIELCFCYSYYPFHPFRVFLASMWPSETIGDIPLLYTHLFAVH